MTSEEDWDPSILDLDITEDENWFDAISGNHEYMINSPFDEFGDYRKRFEVQQHSYLSIEESVDKCVMYHTNQLIVNIFTMIILMMMGVISMKKMMISSSFTTRMSQLMTSTVLDLYSRRENLLSPMTASPSKPRNRTTIINALSLRGYLLI